jgi:hypothetical protein
MGAQHPVGGEGQGPANTPLVHGADHRTGVEPGYAGKMKFSNCQAGRLKAERDTLKTKATIAKKATIRVKKAAKV